MTMCTGSLGWGAKQTDQSAFTACQMKRRTGQPRGGEESGGVRKEDKLAGHRPSMSTVRDPSSSFSVAQGNGKRNCPDSKVHSEKWPFGEGF